MPYFQEGEHTGECPGGQNCSALRRYSGYEPWEVVPCFAIIFMAAAVGYYGVEVPCRKWLQVRSEPQN